MKKNKITQIVASLALFAIVIGIVGTGLLIILSPGETTSQVELTPEQITELQQLIESQSGSTLSGTTLNETSTGSITNE